MSIFELFDKKLQQGSSLVASDPVSLSSISDDSSEQEFAVGKSRSLQNIELKIDYSDFSNFVFYNSAEDYFNISGERILNEYPYDGTREQLQTFVDDSDGYQRYLLSTWPHNSGHLRFVQASSSFISFSDVGRENGSAVTSLLSPNTGSLTLEVWYKPSSASLAGSTSKQFLFQKASSAGNGYSLYLSGSSVFFRVVSGSSVNEVSALADGAGNRYVAAVLDRSTFSGSISLFTGSSLEFPVLVSSASLGFYTSLDIGSASFSIGSGTLSSATSAYFTGSIGEVRVWKKPRSLNDLSSSFNTKVYAQDGLYGLWNFSETSTLVDGTLRAVVFDRSGHKIDGNIQRYYSGLRGSGSFVNGTSEPVLFFDAPEVSSLVVQQQQSGSAYDRQNDGIITSLFPESFFTEQSEVDTGVLRNFTYMLARLFDEIKSSIGQFSKLNTVNYGDFDQAPDALLADVAKFYGWDFTGNFVSADAFQYFLGKGVLSNIDAPGDLDKKLYEIKNEIWRRVLNNLPYIYKTKGTRESIEALLRSYGVRNGLFRVKEYATDLKTGLIPQRVDSDKSVNVAVFGSSSLTSSIYQSGSNVLGATDHSIEMRVMFPLTSSAGLQASVITGTLWTLAGGTGSYYSLVYSKDATTSQTGSLFLTSSIGLVAQLTGAGIFDGKWQNVSVVFSRASGTVNLTVRDVAFGEVSRRFVSSSAAPLLTQLLTGSVLNRTIVGSPQFVFGTAFDTYRCSQYWAQEFRVWSLALDSVELDDHALNFQSYGLRRPRTSYDGNLLKHWRLDSSVSASAVATNADQFYELDIGRAPAVTYVTGTNFSVGASSTKVLNEYSYSAAPDLGWTDDKIRTIDGTRQRRSDIVIDGNTIAIELNLVDALNEDVTQLMSSFDELNSILGIGASRYHETYDGLRHLRQQYFRRLQGRMNFRVFADMLEFFDRSFLTMVERLIPARATFIGDEFVVEPHMLERPKFQYGRHLEQEASNDFTGVIDTNVRFSSRTDDTSVSQTSGIDGVAQHRQIRQTPPSVKG